MSDYDIVFDSLTDGYSASHEALAALDRMESQLKAIKGEGWISVEDRLPESQKRVIVHGGCGYYVEREKQWYTCVEKDQFGFDRPILWEVTHWMPLPSPPQVKRES